MCGRSAQSFVHGSPPRVWHTRHTVLRDVSSQTLWCLVHLAFHTLPTASMVILGVEVKVYEGGFLDFQDAARVFGTLDITRREDAPGL